MQKSTNRNNNNKRQLYRHKQMGNSLFFISLKKTEVYKKVSIMIQMLRIKNRKCNSFKKMSFMKLKKMIIINNKIKTQKI